MKTIKVVAAFLFLASAGFIYVVFASHSEHREYQKLSIDYLALTPIEITGIAQFCKDKPHFIYSAAEGQKPSMTKVSCQLTDDVLSYLSRENFSKTSDTLYKRNNREIELTWNEGRELSSATLLEFM